MTTATLFNYSYGPDTRRETAPLPGIRRVVIVGVGPDG
jgi:hypothetical protein